MKENLSDYETVEFDNESYTTAERYKGTAEESKEFEFYNYCIGRLQELEPDLKSVLDVGMGVGWFGAIIPAEIDYTGVDWCTHAVKLARQHNANNSNRMFATMDADEMFTEKFAKDAFDNGTQVVIFMEFLEHQYNDLKFLNVLPKGMKVLLTVPDFKSRGHVRTFESNEDVKKRYSMIDGNCETFTFKGGSRIFVLTGVKK